MPIGVAIRSACGFSKYWLVQKSQSQELDANPTSFREDAHPKVLGLVCAARVGQTASQVPLQNKLNRVSDHTKLFSGKMGYARRNTMGQTTQPAKSSFFERSNGFSSYWTWPFWRSFTSPGAMLRQSAALIHRSAFVTDAAPCFCSHDIAGNTLSISEILAEPLQPLPLCWPINSSFWRDRPGLGYVPCALWGRQYMIVKNQMHEEWPVQQSGSTKSLRSKFVRKKKWCDIYENVNLWRGCMGFSLLFTPLTPHHHFTCGQIFPAQ